MLLLRLKPGSVCSAAIFQNECEEVVDAVLMKWGAERGPLTLTVHAAAALQQESASSVHVAQDTWQNRKRHFVTLGVIHRVETLQFDWLDWNKDSWVRFRHKNLRVKLKGQTTFWNCLSLQSTDFELFPLGLLIPTLVPYTSLLKCHHVTMWKGKRLSLTFYWALTFISRYYKNS